MPPRRPAVGAVRRPHSSRRERVPWAWPARSWETRIVPRLCAAAGHVADHAARPAAHIIDYYSVETLVGRKSKVRKHVRWGVKPLKVLDIRVFRECASRSPSGARPLYDRGFEHRTIEEGQGASSSLESSARRRPATALSETVLLFLYETHGVVSGRLPPTTP